MMPAERSTNAAPVQGIMRHVLDLKTGGLEAALSAAGILLQSRVRD